MATDKPDWARATPRQVKDILTEALDARELGAATSGTSPSMSASASRSSPSTPIPTRANRRSVKHLMNEREAMFTFLTHDGVDATNWRAEQAIRPAVVNRKVWGGNRTWRGAATQGRIMSVLRTATQRGIDPIEFLVQFARAPDPAGVSTLQLKSEATSTDIHINQFTWPRYPSTDRT